VACCELAVRFILGGARCGKCGGLHGSCAGRTASSAEIWRLLRSVEGRGRYWWWGVGGAARKRAVAVDAGISWVS
jgi:hypothetical protein